MNIHTASPHGQTLLLLIESKRPFTPQKNWVRTQQEKSTDLTFLPVQTLRIMSIGMGTDPCVFRFWGHRRL